ncbi:MAG: SRPBCC domain-containing protein [Alphaproteobacteria bacterium]|nr:SRPBCC domain-containing protein [Alphaproteobacteria bacterium]
MTSDIDVFTISRTLGAPRDLVFTCFTTGEHMAKWFGPKGATVTHSDMDFREGGIYHYAMKMGSAPEMWGRFFYRNIARGSRIALISSFSNPAGGISKAPFFDGKWPLEIDTNFSLEDVAGGKTKFTVTWMPRGASDEERSTFDANRTSMNGGWTGTLDQIEAYLATLTKR